MSIHRMRTEFGHYLKPILVFIAFIFLVGAIWSFGTAPTGKGRGAQGEGDVIATVNGTEVLRSDFESMWDRVLERAKQMRLRSPLIYSQLRAQTFEQLLTNAMLIEGAKKMDIDVSDRRIDEEQERAVTQYLVQNRERVLGKLTKAEAATDPRDDRDYLSALERAGLSLDQQEKIAVANLSRFDLGANVAMAGISRKLQQQVKPVTQGDVAASYNTYKYREVALAFGKLPKAQVQARAEKIQREARGGADFATLARQNSESPTKAAGGAAVYSWDTRMVVPLEVRSALEKLQPGGISPIVETQFGLYVLKLESVAPNAPAKLDDKAKAARRAEINEERMTLARQSFMRQVVAGVKVEVTDPELKGYYLLTEARGTASPAQAQAKIDEAVKTLRNAGSSSGGNYAQLQLTQVLNQLGRTKEAVAVLYPLVEGKNATMEGADLRMLLGDMLVKLNEKDRALDEYKMASEVAQYDVTVYQQLVTKFKELGRPDLAAEAQQKAAEYEKNAAVIRARQGASGAPMSPGMPPQVPAGQPRG